MTQVLPPDIVHEIFKDYAAPYRLTMRQPQAPHSTPSPVFPWFLAHVCSLWRNVFMSMHPEFWSRYILYPSDASSESIRSIIEQTQFFLERTHTKPFSFEILSVIPKNCECILEMLVAESLRWVDVSLVITDIQVPLLTPVQNRLPLLRSLSIDNEPPCVPGTYKGIFSNSPHLRHLTLPSNDIWHFNWSSLTSLRLTRRHDRLLHILSQLINLEELFIPRYDDWDLFLPRDKEPTPILLPRLKSLSVPRLEFLPFLNTPSLKRLCINVDRYSIGWSTPTALISLFRNSSCKLEHLAIMDCIPRVLSVILPYTPGLRSLETGRSVLSGPGDHFSILTCSRENSMPASQLETLRVVLGTPMGAASKPLLSLIKSRTSDRPTPSVQHLQQLVLILPGNMSQQDLPSLSAVHQLCELCGVDFRFEQSNVLLWHPDDPSDFD